MAQIKGADDSREVISALSRPFHLGMLYDACSDQLVPGVSIWKTEDLAKASRVNLQPNTRYQVSCSQSISQKTNLLDVSASVKLGFCAGLIEAGGSAHFLKNQTSSNHQCSVTFHYRQTTDFKELVITELEAPNPEVFDKIDATHVVVGVLYGADALMEFQQSASNKESKQDIEGNLNVMIKKIPGVEISGDGSLKMKDEDKEKVQNFSCKFYGDVQVDSVPSTYEGAVQLYSMLPKLLGEKGEKAVPLKVWLYPLSKFNNTEMKLKRVISETLVNEAEKIMEDFHQAQMRTNDLLEDSKKIELETMTEKLKDFQGSLSVFRNVFLSKLSELIPVVRRGEKTDTDMANLLQSREKLGFSGEQMKQWLDQKETEISIVTDYIKSLKNDDDDDEKNLGVDIKSGPDLESYLLKPDVDDVYMFSFTSLEYEEPYLKKVKEAAVDLEKILSNGTPEQEPGQEVPWYKKEDARKALKESLEVFQAVQGKVKIISFISDPQHPGASIRLYQNSLLKDPHFTLPDEPVTREDFLLYSCHFTLDPNTAHRKLHLSEGNRRVEWSHEAQSYPDHPDRFDGWFQVLCREGVSARCYWEVEWSGSSVGIAVSYKSISRKGGGNECVFGHNDKSWSLNPRGSSCSSFYHNAEESNLPLVASSRIGVYVDHRAGTLAFYSISGDTMTLLHRVHTTFTHTLYPGFWVYGEGSSVKLL